MTREEILTMSSGRKLDALVAEKIMGWTKKKVNADECFDITGDCCANILWLDSHDAWAYEPDKYSTDISVAWEIVNRFYPITIKHQSTIGDETSYFVTVWPSGESAYATFAPEAICKAVLLSIL